MEGVGNTIKIAMLFPFIVMFLVSFIIIPILINGNYNIKCGDGTIISFTEFAWPTPGYKIISSPFGRRSSPTKGASSYHKGVDIAANQGSNVLSIASGTVTFAGFSSSGGNMIIIEHQNGYDSRYCHLSEKLLVKNGETVQKGQIIGTVGPKYLSDGRLNGATTRCTFTFRNQKKWNICKST